MSTILRITSGSQSGTSVPLREGSYVVGRARDADLVLHDRSASRRHTEVIVGDDGLRVRDLGSANGTRVNGRRIDGDTPLRVGDTLTIAKTQLVIADDVGGRLRLACQDGPDAGREFPLAEGRTVIGRDRQCEIRLDHEAVAPLHAAIKRSAEGMQLHDLNSRTGTWLNGDRVSGATALRAGDEILVGDDRFEVIDPEIHDLDPETFPGYTLVNRIGIASLGATYRARRHRSDEMVALKIFPPSTTSDPAIKARLLNAARGLARIEHDHLVPVIEVLPADDHLLVACALAANGSLADLLDEDELPPPMVVAALLRDAARGLAEASRHGLHHGGLRPSNILIDDEGLGMVADLGLTAAVTKQVTAGGEHPYYRSPEELAGHPADDLSDIYALGAVAYHALTGTPPFAEFEDEQGFDSGHLQALPSIRDYQSAVPAPLEAMVGHLLAQRRPDRYQGWDAVIADLDAVIRDGAGARIRAAPAGAGAGAIARTTGVQRRAVRPARGRGARVGRGRGSQSEWAREMQAIPSGIRSLLYFGLMLIVFLFLFAVGRHFYLEHEEAEKSQRDPAPTATEP